MPYHPSRLSQKAREKIIQAQEPVQSNPEQELIILCEVIKSSEGWYQYYCQRTNFKAAERTAQFLEEKRAKLRIVLNDLFLHPISNSVTS